MKESHGFSITSLLIGTFILVVIIILIIPKFNDLINSNKNNDSKNDVTTNSLCLNAKMFYNAIDIFKIQEILNINEATSDIIITINNKNKPSITGDNYNGIGEYNFIDNYDVFSQGKFILSKNGNILLVEPLIDKNNQYQITKVDNQECQITKL